MAWPTTPANNDLYTTAQGHTYVYRTSENAWKRLRPGLGIYPNTIVRAESQTLSAGDKTQALTNMGMALPVGTPFQVNMRTTSGSYSYDANTKYAIIYLQAGGGAGGSANSGSATNADAGSGGAGGDCVCKIIDVEALRDTGNTTYTVAIGAGGANGSSNLGTVDTNELQGSGSGYYDQLNSVSTGTGGGGGIVGDRGGTDGASGHYTMQCHSSGQAFTSGSGFDWVIPGMQGWPGSSAGDTGNGGLATSTHHAQGGHGGRSFFGGGAHGPRIRGAGSDQITALASRGYGAGGAGGGSVHNGTVGGGQPGTDGCCLVIEFR